MNLPRFFRFDGYKTIDVKEFLTQVRIEIHLEAKDDRERLCHSCGTELSVYRGRYRMRIEGLPIMQYRCFIYFWRYKGHCSNCQKARAEAVSFIADESPHLTQDFAWFIGNLCEFSPVSRVAEILKLKPMTVWRVDFRRMKRMLSLYKIPGVTHICVDEVHARSFIKYDGENNYRKFFTMITDLKTRRVLWVAESRDRTALDQFFILLGDEACRKIQVVATDQFEGFASSVRDYCPYATLVWDKFHIMKNFEEAVNDTRKLLHLAQAKGSDLKKQSAGKFRFLFLKKESRRTEKEKKHINKILEENADFAKLEIIKERMLTFFYQPDTDKAKEVFDEIGEWIFQGHFEPLGRWYGNLKKGWNTLKNYFVHPVTTALAEGKNNVVKAIKRRAFRFRNMYYFRLKIMQVCGYLNARYIHSPDQLLTQ